MEGVATASGHSRGCHQHKRIYEQIYANLPRVRTTLNISDDLYQAVKIEAARRGDTVTSLVEESLRRLLDQPGEAARVPFPVSSRSGGLRPGVDLTDPDQMYDLLYGADDGDSDRGIAQT